MRRNAVYIFNEESLQYHFHDKHPFRQERLVMTHDLMRLLGTLDDESIIRSTPADNGQIARIHTHEYIQAVSELSAPNPSAASLDKADRFGLGEGDTPYFENMHRYAAIAVGGTIEACEQVMSGRATRAVHLAGGLHHALSNQAGGFCIYNDASCAIAHIRERYDCRVLYVDTDVHHGDGVQWSFYSDPNVFTFSIHETGKYLFPGTGAVHERGEGAGFGACLNMPVEPYTEDESWMECFSELLERVVAHFKPDIIISQHGCDAHAYDPLAHVYCSMDIYRRMPMLIKQAADTFCEGRWVALGGGGYDIWRVVPRAWTLLWLTVCEHPLVDSLSYDSLGSLPEEWLRKWQPVYGRQLPSTWLDDLEQLGKMPRREEITNKNRQTKELARLYLP